MSKLTISQVLCLARLLTVIFATDITVFTDDKCKRSWRALDAVNGYPDGLCKPLNVTESQSFQIQKLDLGCVVTLYGANAGPLSCSSETKVVGHLANCYDSSWTYYSIDGCLPPTSSKLGEVSVAPTPNTTNSTQGALAKPGSRTSHGIVIGSTVAGVSLIILLLVGVFVVLRHRRRRRKIVPLKSAHELGEDRSLAESDAAAEKKYPKELWGSHAAIEMGRNSQFEGSWSSRRTTLDRQGLRGVNPLTEIHYVP